MSIRSTIALPDPLKAVLDLRKTETKCRPDIEIALTKYGLVHSVPKAAPAPSSKPVTRPESRFTHLGNCAAPEGWRSKNVAAMPSRSGCHMDALRPDARPTMRPEAPAFSEKEDDKWVNVSTSKKRHGVSTFRRPEASAVPKEDRPATAWKSSRFQPLEETIATESMEDRIMGKVRAKVNKLGHSTFDATKAFMKQILDSGEVDFLEECMRFVFGKAAMESTFCGLYARFLHELADEFPHLRDAMVRKFREYTRVFDEASKAPDVGTSDYKAFVEAQEQKKFRRGYSQFVAELAKLGEVSMEDFRLLVDRVVDTIQICHVKEEDRLLCEEVIDCFFMMVKAVKVDWMREYVDVLRSVSKAPKDASPGLSNKGRFALMDILDLVLKGR
jgi:hypothetical protein